MKPYFAKSGAWVQFETLIPSGMYSVTLYAPDDNKHDHIRCDSYCMAQEYRRAFVALAKNFWG